MNSELGVLYGTAVLLLVVVLFPASLDAAIVVPRRW